MREGRREEGGTEGNFRMVGKEGGQKGGGVGRGTFKELE